jgi:hypothetical protein
VGSTVSERKSEAHQGTHVRGSVSVIYLCRACFVEAISNYSHISRAKVNETVDIACFVARLKDPIAPLVCSASRESTVT